MQRRASSTYGATKASVGHASRHRVHVPQRSGSAASSASSTVVRTTPMKKYEPRAGWRSIVFFPPSRARPDGQVPLEHRPGIHVRPRAGPGTRRAGRPPARRAAAPSPRRSRHPTRNGPVGPPRGLGALMVVERDHDHRPRAGTGRRVEAPGATARHVRHRPRVAGVQPGVELRAVRQRAGRPDGRQVEAEGPAGRLDAARERLRGHPVTPGGPGGPGGSRSASGRPPRRTAPTPPSGRSPPASRARARSPQGLVSRLEPGDRPLDLELLHPEAGGADHVARPLSS